MIRKKKNKGTSSALNYLFKKKFPRTLEHKK